MEFATLSHAKKAYEHRVGIAPDQLRYVPGKYANAVVSVEIL